MKFINKLLLRLYEISPRYIVERSLSLVGYQKPLPKISPPTRDFLLSKEYNNIMMEFVPNDGNYGFYEAYTYTRSYINRHHTHLRKLGVFRWRGVAEHLDEILPHVADQKKVVIDLGGGGCPLGFNANVVDRIKTDAMGRPVKYSSLKQVPGPVDTVFACHVLEHIDNLDETLKDVYDILKAQGVFIVFVPSFSNVGWRAGIHKNKNFGGHVWTFGLSKTSLPEGLINYRHIDDLLRQKFVVDTAEYCGDDSIYCFCRKK